MSKPFRVIATPPPVFFFFFSLFVLLSVRPAHQAEQTGGVFAPGPRLDDDDAGDELTRWPIIIVLNKHAPIIFSKHFIVFPMV